MHETPYSTPPSCATVLAEYRHLRWRRIGWIVLTVRTTQCAARGHPSEGMTWRTPSSEGVHMRRTQWFVGQDSVQDKVSRWPACGNDRGRPRASRTLALTAHPAADSRATKGSSRLLDGCTVWDARPHRRPPIRPLRAIHGLSAVRLWAHPTVRAANAGELRRLGCTPRRCCAAAAMLEVQQEAVHRARGRAGKAARLSRSAVIRSPNRKWWSRGESNPRP
jgi:hypothetical protein